MAKMIGMPAQRYLGPILLGLYGLGLIGAGFFLADPAYGFPPGTPADANAVSWHGLLHLICGAIGFFARRFASERLRGWTAYSIATGVLFFAAFVGIATGSNGSGTAVAVVILAFDVAVVSLSYMVHNTFPPEKH